MAIEHEALNKKILELRFRPEGYVGNGDSEFLDQLATLLTNHGLDPAKLVYRGFDGNLVDPNMGLPRDPIVYAMNIAGWENAIRYKDHTPVHYADGAAPCLAVYDGDQLAEPSSVEHLNADTMDIVHDQIMLGNIKKGDNLADMMPGRIVNEEVVHKDFPEASPTDALVALVYLDE